MKDVERENARLKRVVADLSLEKAMLANGNHSLIAKAYDAAGNVGTSGAVNFSVSNAGSGDTTAPTVSATESGASGTISFSATANVGVTKVEFYVDSTLVAPDTPRRTRRRSTPRRSRMAVTASSQKLTTPPATSAPAGR